MARMSRFYITTPIFYVNGDPHLGTAYAAINADAFARWHRLLGDEVLFLTGTDEHGLKIQQSADEHGISPQAWVDQTASRFMSAWQELAISFDDFIRTTQDRHHRTVQKFLTAIYENGYIEKGYYIGLYCVACEAYYEESELLDGNRCPIHERPVSEMSEENYFFKLSAFTEKLIELYESGKIKVAPEFRVNEVLGFLRQGLKDISITRTSISWGVQVPWDEQHVFYVWYDALINYLTAISYGDDEARFAKWWPAVHHLLGKDIIRFHAVWWPAMCLAAGIDPPSQLLVSGWLLVDGAKMSKSSENQIDPLSVVRELSADALRYYLLASTSFGSDGDVSLDRLRASYNADLANDLGNLVSRTVALIVQKLGGMTPPTPVRDERINPLIDILLEGVAAWNEFRPNAALGAAMGMVRFSNSLLEEYEPWRRPAEDAGSIWCLGTIREALRLAAALLSPAIPNASSGVLSRLGWQELGPLEWSAGGEVRELVRAQPLFPRLAKEGR
ncbi:class I tRNA ligase family protein [Ferrimicrobium sp.]|uniref:class I tRNA ligase family protein n=1 Tax=Ferrimicrobium sp. TaxID=2926050 RepID=UPI00260CF1D6|nr:class I tRNA ligase family protein [Ferrimicrobium sp.]